MKKIFSLPQWTDIFAVHSQWVQCCLIAMLALKSILPLTHVSSRINARCQAVVWWCHVWQHSNDIKRNCTWINSSVTRVCVAFFNHHLLPENWRPFLLITSLSLLLISLGCQLPGGRHPAPFLPARPRLSTILCKFAHKMFSFGCQPLEVSPRAVHSPHWRHCGWSMLWQWPDLYLQLSLLLDYVIITSKSVVPTIRTLSLASNVFSSVTSVIRAYACSNWMEEERESGPVKEKWMTSSQQWKCTKICSDWGHEVRFFSETTECVLSAEL